jgi:hypothetical protein
MASVYPAKITLHAIPEIVNKHNLLVDLLGKDLSFVVQGGGVGDVKSPVFPGAINDTVVLFDGTSGKQIKASTIYADWFDQSVATTASPTFGDVTVTTLNELTLVALATGFSIAGGDTSKTLTVPDDATVSGTNTGDQDLTPYALKTNVLELDNAVPFAPDADYEPATKLYVDSAISTALPIQVMTPMSGLTIDTTWRDWTPLDVTLVAGSVYQVFVTLTDGTDKIMATGQFVWSGLSPAVEWNCEIPLHQISSYSVSPISIYLRTAGPGGGPMTIQIAGSDTFTAPVLEAKFLKLM